ncbi:MAG TPA: hypothetical protein VMJ90_08390 [Anaerolineales bacterium]|nr:hypothetical protein [Anaerolineales bacterium]
MVHALGEIRRVLVREGILIDLRPLLAHASIEVVSASETRLAGRVDQLPEDRAGDEAADRAITYAEKQGWFIKDREEFFPFNYYWDSPKETQEYLEAEWSNSVTVDEKVWRNARSMWAVANADAQVRLQLKMLIARWKKV